MEYARKCIECARHLQEAFQQTQRWGIITLNVLFGLGSMYVLALGVSS